MSVYENLVQLSGSENAAISSAQNSWPQVLASIADVQKFGTGCCASAEKGRRRQQPVMIVLQIHCEVTSEIQR